MSSYISVSNLEKVYDGGFHALKKVNLDIKKGQILALLGPNGAGKTTLISCICGIVNPTGGAVTIDGHDIIKDYRKTRALIGLVPQELTIDAFETVWAKVSFSRGLFGLPKNDAHIEKILKSLSLWGKKDNRIMQLSGGMKRRVLIAQALAHEPRILFLDEPTAGVDVELRRDMWNLVRELQADGVTIILTTHYIEEAEEIAETIAVINDGEIIVIEEKDELMKKLGKKTLVLQLQEKMPKLPDSFQDLDLNLSEDHTELIYTYDTNKERTGITALLQRLADADIRYVDLDTKNSSLEEIFVTLVNDDRAAHEEEHVA